jgi:hypothetical protein
MSVGALSFYGLSAGTSVATSKHMQLDLIELLKSEAILLMRIARRDRGARIAEAVIRGGK